MVTINLTLNQAEKLLDDIMCYTDDGPQNEGWKSAELCGIIGIIEKAVKEAKDRQGGVLKPRGSSMSCQLFVVGESSPNPDTWSAWDDYSFVIAETAAQAIELAGDFGPVAEIPMNKPMHLFTHNDGSWRMGRIYSRPNNGVNADQKGRA